MPEKDYDLDEILGEEKKESPYRKIEEGVWSDIKMWIPTGVPSLDYAIGGYRRGFKGGIPHGKVIEIWGPESSGKSALLDHIMREALDMGFTVFLGDDEKSHEEERMKQIGIDTDHLRFVEKPPKYDKHGVLIPETKYSLEEYFQKFEEGVKKVAAARIGIPVLVALDCLASVDTRSQQEVAYDEATMKTMISKASIMSMFFGRFCETIRSHNGTVIIVNQLRHEVAGFLGPNDYSPGGVRKNYEYSLRIKLNQGSFLKAAEDPLKEHREEFPVGLVCSFLVNKNKVGPPRGKGKFVLYFDERGICPYHSFALMLMERKVWEEDCPFEKSGSWFSWEGEKLGQGIKGLIAKFAEDPEIMREIEQNLFGEE